MLLTCHPELAMWNTSATLIPSHFKKEVVGGLCYKRAYQGDYDQ
jgi:hypothetical protein